MPAPKPSTLSQRHDTKADRAARTAAESAMAPKTQLSSKPPERLRGHVTAQSVWKRIVALYQELDGEIATAFDADLLTKYCLLQEEVIELEKLRAEMMTDYKDQHKAAKKIKPNPETLKDWLAMWTVVNALGQKFQGLDARLDGKRKLMLSIEQSLYLTPRSRAGVTPPTKPPEDAPSEMDDILG